MGTIFMSDKERKRLEVFSRVTADKISLMEATCHRHRWRAHLFFQRMCDFCDSPGRSSVQLLQSLQCFVWLRSGASAMIEMQIGFLNMAYSSEDRESRGNSSVFRVQHMGVIVAEPKSEPHETTGDLQDIAPAAIELSVAISCGWTAVDEFASDWESLADEVEESPFFATPGWYRAWRRAFGQLVEPQFVSVRAGNRLVGLLPLRLNSHHKLGISWRRYSSLENEYTPESCILLAPGQEDKVFNAALVHILEAGPLNYLHFPGVREDSVTARVLENVAARKQFHCLRDATDFASELVLKPNAPGYEASLPAKTRKRLGRDIRRAHRQLKLETQIVEQREDFDKVLPSLRKISGASWQGNGGTGTFGNGVIGEFYTEISRQLADRSELRIVLLHADGQPAAFELSAVNGQRLMVLKREFDARHRDAGIGKVALDELYKHGHGQGMKCLSLGAPRAPYKKDWANTRTISSDWLLFRAGAMGELQFACSQGLRCMAKRLLLPDRIRWT